jgi:hypothetical protein
VRIFGDTDSKRLTVDGVLFDMSSAHEYSGNPPVAWMPRSRGRFVVRNLETRRAGIDRTNAPEGSRIVECSEHYVTAPPTTGRHLRGEVFVNMQPAIGAPAEWRCVTSGMPGHFRPLVLLP